MFEPISFTHRCPKGLRVAILPGHACPGCGDKAPEATVTTDLIRLQTQKLLLSFAVMAAEDQFRFYGEEHRQKALAAGREGRHHDQVSACAKSVANEGLAKQLSDALAMAASTTATPSEMLRLIDTIRAASAAREASRPVRH